jgi:hypothetical protein
MISHLTVDKYNYKVNSLLREHLPRSFEVGRLFAGELESFNVAFIEYLENVRVYIYARLARYGVSIVSVNGYCGFYRHVTDVDKGITWLATAAAYPPWDILDLMYNQLLPNSNVVIENILETRVLSANQNAPSAYGVVPYSHTMPGYHPGAALSVIDR